MYKDEPRSDVEEIIRDADARHAARHPRLARELEQRRQRVAVAGLIDRIRRLERENALLVSERDALAARLYGPTDER